MALGDLITVVIEAIVEGIVSLPNVATSLLNVFMEGSTAASLSLALQGEPAALGGKPQRRD